MSELHKEQMMKDPKTIPIKDAGFPKRVQTTLKLYFPNFSLDDVAKLNDKELLHCRSFGVKCLADFKETLVKNGFVYTPVSIRITKQMRKAAQLFGVTPENYAHNMLELIGEGIWGVPGEKYPGTTYRYVWQPPKEDKQ
jgi:hypothetical protein